MRNTISAIAILLSLTACGESDQSATAGPATQRIEFESASRPEPAAEPANADTCPAGSATVRAKGANCFGIMPAQCGADRAAEFVGRELDAGLRGRLDAMSHSGARYLEQEAALPDELEPGRLNVLLDANQRIVGFDCY